MIKLIISIFIISNFLFAQVSNEETNTNTTQNEIEEQLNLNNEFATKVIKNLSNDTYLKNKSDFEEINKKINYLQSKISINKKQNNTLAVFRDELEVIKLRVNKRFETTMINISNSIHDYKSKEFFLDIINKNIEFLDGLDLDSYSKTFDKTKDDSNTIDLAFNENYTDVYNLLNRQFFTLNYLKNNVDKFRKSNFFIDEFNIQYIIKTVDNQSFIKPISNVSNHYINITVGEFFVVLFVLLFFRMINTKIISTFVNYLSSIISKITNNESYDFKQIIKEAFNTPLKFILYTFAIQVSILILVDDTLLISSLTPWINTIYMAVATWIFYKLMDSSINIYVQRLLQTYPNVRKEMIVFILRIIKIILILVVILFLFSQLGIDIKAIAASLGVGGIAIALASKDTLANFFGSLNIMTDNSFSQGDWIKTSTVEGTVVDIRMRTTRIRTFDNALITVPNSELANAHIMNWSKRIVGRRIKMSLGITYESKMQDIVNLKNDINNMLLNHPDIANEENIDLNDENRFDVIKHEDLKGVKKTLLVYIDEYADSSINILIYCFSKSPNWEDWLKTKEDVMIKISELVYKNNCEFAYPAQTIHLKRDDA